MGQRESDVSGLVDRWIASRAELESVEKAEHPDITDRLGRVWVWRGREIYDHCGMAWTYNMITGGVFVLPKVHYTGMCATCCGGHEHEGTP